MPLLKYRLRERLDALPGKLRADAFHRILRACKISRRTLQRWCNISLEDFADVPAQSLDLIANELGTTPDELKNYKIIKIQSNAKTDQQHAA